MVGSFSPSDSNVVHSKTDSLGKLQEVEARQMATAEDLIATTGKMGGSQGWSCTSKPWCSTGMSQSETDASIALLEPVGRDKQGEIELHVV